MADEPSWDDIFDSQPPQTPAPPPAQQPPAQPPPAQPQTTQPQTRREAREAAEAAARDAAPPLVEPTTAATPTALPGAPSPAAQPPASSLPPAAMPPAALPPAAATLAAVPAPSVGVIQPTSAARGTAGKPPKVRGQRKSRRTLGCLIVVVAFFSVIGIGASFVYVTFEDQIRTLLGTEEPTDFTGAGTGEVVVTIAAGDVGGDIAQTLVDEGVTKTYSAFYALLIADPTITFQPGSYSLKSEMSAQAALDALTDPANRVQTTVRFNEGQSISQVLATISDETGIALADFEAAAANPAAFGVPVDAPSLEGFLFPATYEIEPGTDATAILQMLVTRTFQSLDAAGVAPEDRLRVMTMAALIQREAGPVKDDFFKVSRVFANRIAIGMNLESDATVSYGTGRTDTVWTTPDERADASNRYNTYANPGLPAGPIGAAGDLAIDAALHPAEGPWLFFVPINLETGETVFSETFAQHQAAVAQLDAWCRATQSPNCQ
ncbi:MAG: endolytic transglycosylase MltG [Burkholderiaceae bacterium]|nr:endolytic transglycosylase MltG [Microbacteriaceae bacterium]